MMKRTLSENLKEYLRFAFLGGTSIVCAIVFSFMLSTNVMAQETRTARFGDDQEKENQLPPVISILSEPIDSKARRSANRFGLTRKDFEQISKVVTMFGTPIPIRVVEEKVYYLDRESKAQIIGTEKTFLKTGTVKIERGRFLSESDERKSENVCVISSKLAKELFRFTNPIGRVIRTGKNFFTVVGVASTDNPTKSETPHAVFIPRSTMKFRFGDTQLIRDKGSMELRIVEIHEIRILLDPMADERKLIDRLLVLLEKLRPNKDYILQTDESNSND